MEWTVTEACSNQMPQHLRLFQIKNDYSDNIGGKDMYKYNVKYG